MSILYQPAVRIVLGYAGRAEAPPPTYASAATLALQKAVTKLGKDWMRVAPMFLVAPAARSGRVVVGLAMSRVPQVLEAPGRIGPGSAFSKEHYVVSSDLREAPDVDKHGNTQAHRGILDALAAGVSDPALAGLGLSLEDPTAAPAYFLVSDDGRAGALVFGQALWKLGGSYEGGVVRTYTRDYGEGEGVRLVGVPYLEVGPDAPLARIDDSYTARQAHAKTATAAVRSLLDTPAAWGWYLVCDDAPRPPTAASKAAEEEDRGPRGEDDAAFDEEEEDRGPRGEDDAAFDEETEGVLVAGRAFATSSMTRRELGAFARHVAKVGSQAGLSVVAAGDLSETGPEPDDTCCTSLHVGIEVGRGGGHGPDGISRGAMVDSLGAASRIPEAIWAEIGKGLTGAPREAFEASKVALHLTCVGPLAAATLGFGVLGGEDEGGPGVHMSGQNMEQEPHEQGVWGVRVAHAQSGGPRSKEVDPSNEAHAERVARLGGHAAQAGYYIVAWYD